MKPVPALVALVSPAQEIDVLERQIAGALRDQRDAERAAERHEQMAASARETARMRRMEVGRALCEARPAWPSRGPKAKGWGEFLARLKLDDSTAHRYMAEFRDPVAFQRGQDVGGHDGDETHPDRPTRSEASDTAPAPDRDTWCTPRWITDAIGKVDLDPCANERSHVNAGSKFVLARGENGLERAPTIGGDWRVFINPPYSDVTPWIKAYAHTRFVFLLKFDPSTKWFAELIANTKLVLLPRGTRVEFEPPPGVESTANPFPHALFYRRAADATDAIRALCYAWSVNSSIVPGGDISLTDSQPREKSTDDDKAGS